MRNRINANIPIKQAIKIIAHSESVGIGEMDVAVDWLVITEMLELRLFATYALVPSGLKATPIGFNPTVIALITTFVDVLITETLLLPLLVT